MWQYTLRIWRVTWHWQDNLRLCGIARSYYILPISDSLTTKGSISLPLLWVWMITSPAAFLLNLIASLPYTLLTLNMETTHYSEKLVFVNLSILCHNPGDHNLKTCYAPCTHLESSVSASQSKNSILESCIIQHYRIWNTQLIITRKLWFLRLLGHIR